MDCRVKPGNDDVKNRSRGAHAPELCSPPRPRKKIRPRLTHDPEKWCPVFGRDHAQKREAKRRKAHANHCRAGADKCARTGTPYLLRSRAPFSEARPPSGASTAALVRNSDVSDSAPGHASWDVDNA
jgi:hypothetical protein